MRWWLFGSTLGVAGAIAACAAFSATSRDEPEPASEAGDDALTAPDAPDPTGGPSEAGTDGALAPTCLGKTVAWDFTSITPPFPLGADGTNSSLPPFTPESEADASFGRFEQMLWSDVGDGGARFGVVVDPTHAQACLSVRIRHPFALPSEPFLVEELLAIFLAPEGFSQLVMESGHMATRCSSPDAGETGETILGDASAWHVWRLQVLQAEGGAHVGIFRDGQIVADCAPIPSGAPPTTAVVGFGPRPFSTLPDASVIIDYADLRVDLE